MNATVKRIVDLMFEDLLPSDEVQALHDEVLSNCQERFNDSMNRGSTEDEAISLVIDSLKGMDEMLSGYPRKNGVSSTGANHNQSESDPCQHTFTAQTVDRIIINLNGEDVQLALSDDGSYHVVYDEASHLSVHDDHQTLTIEHSSRTADFDIEVNSFGKKTEAHGHNVSFTSLSDLLSKMFSAAKSELQGTAGKVKIYIPARCQAIEVNTTSGDIEVLDIAAEHMNCTSTSGDITLRLRGECRDVSLKTASGDIEAVFNAANATLSTLSGDCSYRGACPSLNASTVSGDLELEGMLTEVHAKSVSGDMSMAPLSTCRIEATTTSGDIEVYPNSQLSAHLEAKTVSGSIRNQHLQADTLQPDVLVIAKSVSGSIKLS